MSNLLSLEPTLDHLARLRQGIARCREAAGRVEGEFKERIAKLNRQTDVALRETNMRLADDMVAEDEAARQAASACQARHDRRKERILQARQAVESVQLKRIGDEEAREVFHVQREMLQVSRDHQAGQQLADATYASLKEEWADERDRVEKLERAAGRAFLGFRCYRNKLRSACASPGPAPAGRSKDMLELCRDRQNEAYAQLRRLRRSPLPRPCRRRPTPRPMPCGLPSARGRAFSSRRHKV